jgi:hypothetical protein
MPCELALIVEPDERGHVTRERPGGEELLCAQDPELDQVSVRREADLGPKCAAQPEFIEARMRRDLVERDRLGEALAN